MDWLLARQERIEDRLARRHLKDGELVLYDVSCSYFEGRKCPLAKLGYSRDGKRGTPQIVYGLLCDKPGRPVAVEVFSGELHDDKTLPAQIGKLKQRFGLKTVIVVADRGNQIGLAVGPALKRYRMKKHFEIEITDTTFSFARKQAQIAAEATLDGL